MSAAPKPVGAYTNERRGDERITSIYRPVLIEVGGVMRFCLLRNISTAGFMGMAYAEIPEGAAIRIEFSEQNWTQGIVKWCENHRIGVEFSHEIDVLSVLQELGKRVVGGKINRAPRLAIEHPLELEIAKRRMASKMFDISQKGVKIPAGTLSVGDERWFISTGCNRAWPSFAGRAATGPGSISSGRCRSTNWPNGRSDKARNTRPNWSTVHATCGLRASASALLFRKRAPQEAP